MRERYIAAMGVEKPLFEDQDAEAERSADGRAEADARAGRVIGHEAVRRWLGSWGKDKPLPRPRVGD